MQSVERSVSIIIPTYNRPRTLQSVINSYICQKHVIEIIIIDDNSSTDYSAAISIIKEKCFDRNIKCIYVKNVKNLGAAGTRNVGLGIATGDYILWGEDDAFLSETYVEDLLRKMQEKQIGCGSIYYDIYPELSQQEKDVIIQQQQSVNKPIFDYSNFEGYYRKNVEKPIVVPYGHALVLVPRKAYEGVCYYEGYKVNGYREESDAQVVLTQKGYEIVYVSNARCYHLPAWKIEKGGQHMHSRVTQEIYTILNNNIFYDRHYEFFCKKYALKKRKNCYKLEFALKRIKIKLDNFMKRLKGF